VFSLFSLVAKNSGTPNTERHSILIANTITRIVAVVLTITVAIAMDQSYFNQPPFRMPLTPVASASASPYDRHSLGALTAGGFEEFGDASASFHSYGVCYRIFE
jgi:hypothetical protein